MLLEGGSILEKVYLEFEDGENTNITGKNKVVNADILQVV